MKSFPKKILIGTYNQAKIKCFKYLLEPLGVQSVTPYDLNLEDVEETGTTYEENALLKASTYAGLSNMATLADDSGFEVIALDRQPGLYSARWSEDESGNRDFAYAWKKIHNALGNKPNDTEFMCALALCIPNEEPVIVSASVPGYFIYPPRMRDEQDVSKGFGYYPVFQPKGHNRTMGEMSFEEVMQLSSRRVAFDKLLALFNEYV